MTPRRPTKAQATRGPLTHTVHGDWGKISRAVRGPLINELCRVFNAKRVGVECMLRHGQILVDGFIMRESYDNRWTKEQLAGRAASITYYGTSQRREARLYR